MPWGDNGVTIRRQLQDQSATITWGASPVRVPFKALRTAGYLRSLRIWTPQTAVPQNGATIALPTPNLLPVWQGINRFQLTLQGIAQLYDVSGLDIFGLMYVRNGNSTTGQSWQTGYQEALGSGSNVVAGAQMAPNWGNHLVPAAAALYGAGAGVYVNGTVNMWYGAYAELPITEYLTIKDAVVASGQNTVVVADKAVELGMLTLQNTSSNVTPLLQLNPLWGASNSNSPFFASVAVPTPTAFSWNIGTDLYDVPPNPADRPSPMQQAFVITRQSFDTPAAGGASTVQFQAAGSIMRIVYIALDVNGNPYDLVQDGLSGSTNIALRWGATTDKINEYVEENINRCLTRYGQIPPSGYLVHDLMIDDDTATDFINTAEVTNLRTEFKGLSGNVVTIRTMTERLVPVTAM